MTRDSQNDSDGVMVRGAIVILLAGAVIGLVFNAILLASNGDLGLTWIRQEVHLNSLEKMLADSSAVIDEAPAAEETDDNSPPSEDDAGAESRAEEPGKPPVGDVAKPAPPPEVPSVAEEKIPTRDTTAAAGVPVIPDSSEPLLAEHARIKALHSAGAAVFVDARSPEEYAAGHIPGAVNLPFDLVYEDPTLLERFDAGDRPVVSYCDGSECELAENLAFVLIDAGYRKVLVYEGGTLAWTAAGESLVTRGGN